MRLLQNIRRFWTGDSGVLSTEAAMIMPVLLFSYLGMFTFYDGFRTQNVNVRASYTISDMLSREMDCIDDPYINGLNDILGVLTQSQYPSILRVTVLTWDEDDDEFDFEWSEVDGGSGGIVEYTAATVSEIEDRIPVMADRDTVIVVETWSGFVPLFDFGIDAFYLENFVTTRPRFGNQLKWDNGSNPECP